VECVYLAREFGIGTGKLSGGHATPPLPVIVSRCSSSFHGLADDREIILQPANCGVQRAEKMTEDGHAPASGLARRFHDLAAAMNPGTGRDVHTAEAFQGWCWTGQRQGGLRGADLTGRAGTDPQRV
jgi:hypothetical protein